MEELLILKTNAVQEKSDRWHYTDESKILGNSEEPAEEIREDFMEEGM